MIKQLFSIFVKQIAFMHTSVRNAGNLIRKLISFTSFQVLLILPKLSPLTNVNAFYSHTERLYIYVLLLPCIWHVSKIHMSQAFVGRCLDSIISLDYIAEISRL